MNTTQTSEKLGFWGWAFARLTERSFIEFSLLFTGLALLTSTLGDLIRNLTSWQLSGLAAAGIAAGWLLGRSKLSGKFSWLLLLGAWIGAAVLITARLIQPLLALLLEIRLFSIAFVFWLLEGRQVDLPSFESIIQGSQDFWSASVVLFNRIAAWISALLEGSNAYDPLTAELAWSTVIWISAAWAGWFFRRLNKPLAGLTPAGLLLAGTLNYSNSRPLPLIFFMGIVFVLITMIHIRVQEKEWDGRGIDYPSEIRLDVGLPAAPLILLILAASFLASTVDIQKLVDTARSLRARPSGQLLAAGESLGLEREEPPSFRPGSWRPGGLPRSHLLGTGPELKEIPALEVRINDRSFDQLNQLADSPAPNYYWRSLTFEHYTGQGWVNREITTARYNPGEPARYQEEILDGYLPEPAGYRMVQQDLRVFSSGIDVVYSTGNLVSVDREYTVAWRSPRRSGAGEPGGGDIFGATTEAKRYRVYSLVVETDQDELRNAGADYPKWVTDHYLSLPPSLPRRVYNLAYDLTANASTRYDRAVAIESYLRSLPYSLEVPLPPPEQDAVDYYLFDLKAGYCDYAASTMVVLARAAGLPARLVMGYAAGVYDPEWAVYLVSEAEAHSWAEIYFPGVGWVEFEPTGVLPEIHHLQGDQRENDRRTEPFFTIPARVQRAIARLVWVSAGLLGVPVLFGVLVSAYDRWRLQRIPPGAAIARLYQRLYHRGQVLGAQDQTIPPGSTPLELSLALTTRLSGLAAPAWVARAINPADLEASGLADLYNQSSYSPRPPGEDDRRKAIDLWINLRWRLTLAGWLLKNKRRRKG
jgi:transglutaminase-like putative cysteine protease